MAGANDPLGSLEADEKAMKKGKGRMIAAMVVAVVAAVAGLALYLTSGGDDSYAKFGRQVNGLDQRDYDAFWGCVMQGYDLRRIRSDQDLRAQIHERGERGRARFGAHVRDQCLPKLADLETKLQALAPPDAMAPEVRNMVDAVKRLRGAWSDYIAMLDGLEGEEPYDRDRAAEPVGRAVKAWYDYSVALSDVNAELREKLQG